MASQHLLQMRSHQRNPSLLPRPTHLVYLKELGGPGSKKRQHIFQAYLVPIVLATRVF